MAKSHQTFNKREVERKKQQKKKEKEARREERKANPKASLDDMIAYVDENGNISSTPPDPNRKSKIKAEDIVVSVQRRAPEVPDTSFRRGVVKFFNDSKGYGFVEEVGTGERYFVHINSTEEPIKEGNLVSFQTEMGPKGPVAVRVSLLK